jgi:hypothetical protein
VLFRIRPTTDALAADVPCTTVMALRIAPLMVLPFTS